MGEDQSRYPTDLVLLVVIVLHLQLDFRLKFLLIKLLDGELEHINPQVVSVLAVGLLNEFHEGSVNFLLVLDIEQLLL